MQPPHMTFLVLTTIAPLLLTLLSKDRDDAEAADALDDERREHDRAVRLRHAAARRQPSRRSLSGAGGTSPRSAATADTSPRSVASAESGKFDKLWAASAQSHEAALHHEAGDEAQQAR